MSNKPLALRPHHGMCMAYFVGYGYSDSFSRHMARLLAELTPESLVRLRVAVDAVCRACPNNSGGRCDRPALVAGYDRAVLELCDLAEGDILPFGRFAGLVQRRVLEPGLRRTICGGCQWDTICAQTASKWREIPRL